jgi:HSP20 family protein
MKLVDRIERAIPVFGNVHELENLFDSMVGACKKGSCVLTPRTDIVEDSTGFNLSIELPGVEASDVAVEVADERLMVSGEKKATTAGESETVHRRERSSGKFQRSFEFPTQVDFAKIDASFAHGILTVRVPKAEKVLPRKIDITVR